MDAIDEHSRRLVEALSDEGIAADYVPDGLAPLLRGRRDPAWVLVQYNPFRWGRSGFAPTLLADAVRLRRGSKVRLAVLVHEAWIDMHSVKSAVIGLWQRAQLRALLRLADCAFASTEALAAELGGGAVHVPVATNITPTPVSAREARSRLGVGDRFVVTLFGRGHPSRALDYAELAIAALARTHGAQRLMVMNLGADAPLPAVPDQVQILSPGRLGADAVSLRLWASNLLLLPFADGISTRRGTLMAALAHARPVLGLRGPNTDMVLSEADDALALTPLGDRAAFAAKAVAMSHDPEQLAAMGEAGRALYESRFDWPVLARRVAFALEELGPAKPLIAVTA